MRLSKFAKLSGLFAASLLSSTGFAAADDSLVSRGCGCGVRVATEAPPITTKMRNEAIAAGRREISSEKFACNDGSMVVAGTNGNVAVAKDSASDFIPVTGRTIVWWCGSAQEDFQAPEGTTHIRVHRGPRGAGVVIYYQEN